eukprot:3787096-Lingulodinium_polyedra.AAC.1
MTETGWGERERENEKTRPDTSILPHLASNQGLKRADEALEWLDASIRKYYSSIAKLCNVWREYA